MLDLIGRAQAATLPTLTFVGTNQDFKTYVGKLIAWLLVLTAVLAVAFLVYGGIMYITAGGDAEKATKGRTAVVNAIIGVIIVVLAYAIVNWVGLLATNKNP